MKLIPWSLYVFRDTKSVEKLNIFLIYIIRPGESSCA
jgi:hypothetical protein